ncbi:MULTISPECIES: hypothetical protein [Aerococcus]|uniref:Uncharacterized protein n=1 Tax=Aerococcus sanguinicola TaxID=119206 RepID=A0A5N1GJG4_9LACT|nr:MULTISPECIES: hypothetical protein [Aerococcus]KAA9301125.1 hypothetical protein F6I03_04445 [Aerococcus sanguinicola]MDK6369349.1 hypothetical protein [Aerococcus sp. UMB9870]MDK6679175.1 hypothetical protein [Aerococcus sp. UMB8608]MDK6687141.1 hypothetical protein [Aerococcus sp. UMB8623]MDK6940687.1 hypothetical protein [Aerococcus sp. UMB8487]
MNDLIFTYGGTVNLDTLSVEVTLHPSTTARSASSSQVAFRQAFGGAQQFYLSNAEAQNMIQTLESGGSVSSFLSSLGLSIFETAYQGISAPTLSNLKQAASSGNGVVMNVQPNYTAPDLPPSIWFVSQ